MHNQLYMLSHQIPSYNTGHHIKNEVHSMTLILYEGIQYHNLYRRVITLHSRMYLPTTTIVLPLNGVNSNLLNSKTQASIRHFYCSIQKIKFLLDLV